MNQNMIDRAEFVARGGKGGDGAIAFRQGYGVAKGGPAGGTGGKGGSVILRASRHVATLRWFAGKDAFEALNGEKGAKKNQTGKNADDVILEVPMGTIVMVDPASAKLLKGRMVYGKDVEWGLWSGKRVDAVQYSTFEERWGIEGENSNDKTQMTNQIQNTKTNNQDTRNKQSSLINDQISSTAQFVQVIDLDEDGKEVVLAYGGRGGKGNTEFKSSTHTTPKIAQRGERGEQFRIRLELKVLADVGLVGEPNVGKSTILSVVTRAQPEIANYPFTTLSPNLGVMEASGDTAVGRQIVVADIPGLIEDAHTGKGLGTAFLRHVERCKVLVFVVAPTEADVSRPETELVASLWRQFITIRNELKAYGHDLLKKPSMVVINKAELLQDSKSKVEEHFKSKKVEPLFISAALHEGTSELHDKIWKLVEKNS